MFDCDGIDDMGMDMDMAFLMFSEEFCVGCLALYYVEWDRLDTRTLAARHESLIQ